MVNLNNGTKVMVNRCIELLNGKIACAQTRHIAKRVPCPYVNRRTVDTKKIIKEHQKGDQYKESKRLSMWEQTNPQTTNEEPENKRMDNLYYKCSQECERTYKCTWTDFPSSRKAKENKILTTFQNPPVTRRKPGSCPETAKPCDDVAKNFIRQLGGNKNPMLYQDNHANSTNTEKINRKKIFYY